METRKVILYTFIAFLGLLIALGIANYLPFYLDRYNFSSLPFEQKTLTTGNDLVPEIELIDTGAGPIVLLVPGKGADRDWNSGTLANRAGLRVSAALSEKGISILRFDRIDSGKEPNVYLPISKRAEQVVAAVVESRKIVESLQGQRPLYILAHDQGCIDSLIALQDVKLKVQGTILTGCSYSGTVLDQYFERVAYNMKLTGIEPDKIQKVVDYWEKVTNTENPEPVSESDWQKIQNALLEKGMHPDVVAGRKTISILLRDANLDYFKEARALSFQSLIDSVVDRTTIYQLVGQNDEELSNKLIEANARIAKEEKYPFVILPGTGHYLFEQDPPASPVENMAMRRSPFAEVSPAFIEQVLKILPVNNIETD